MSRNMNNAPQTHIHTHHFIRKGIISRSFFFCCCCFCFDRLDFSFLVLAMSLSTFLLVYPRRERADLLYSGIIITIIIITIITYVMLGVSLPLSCHCGRHNGSVCVCVCLGATVNNTQDDKQTTKNKKKVQHRSMVYISDSLADIDFFLFLLPPTHPPPHPKKRKFWYLFLILNGFNRVYTCTTTPSGILFF
jgi:hypothetical protein